MVDAPVRISTPGHSTSGADGVGECGCVTPAVAPEKKLANRLTNEGELSDDPTLEASEQPDNIAALTISAAARRGPSRQRRCVLHRMSSCMPDRGDTSD